LSDGVRLSRALADDMIRHCIDGRPNEACGMLGAKEGGEIVRVFKMANASASPVRYALDPAEQLAVYNAIDELGWELGGVFHSHTHTEAYPSPTDVRLASEDVPYLIVSLMYEPAEIRAFRIVKQSWTAETGDIEEVSVVVTKGN
jgi:proteasome lid subunit RPN8/RPN11